MKPDTTKPANDPIRVMRLCLNAINQLDPAERKRIVAALTALVETEEPKH